MTEQPKKRGVTYDFLWAARAYATNTPTEKLILFYLISCLDIDGIAHPSQKLMAYHLGIEHATVERGIAALKARGIITVTKDGRNNIYRPVLTAIKSYQLLARLPAEAPETKSPGLTVGRGKQHPSPARDDSESYPSPVRAIARADAPHELPQHPSREASIPLFKEQIPLTTGGVRRVKKVEEENLEEGEKLFSHSFPALVSPASDSSTNDEMGLTSDDASPAPKPRMCSLCRMPIYATDKCQQCEDCGVTPPPPIVQMQWPKTVEACWAKAKLAGGLDTAKKICAHCEAIIEADVEECKCGTTMEPLLFDIWMQNQTEYRRLWDEWKKRQMPKSLKQPPPRLSDPGTFDVSVMVRLEEFKKFESAALRAYPTVETMRAYAKDLYDSGKPYKRRRAWYLYATGLLDCDEDDGRLDFAFDTYDSWPWDFKLLQDLDDLKSVPENHQLWMRPKADDPVALIESRKKNWPDDQPEEAL